MGSVLRLCLQNLVFTIAIPLVLAVYLGAYIIRAASELSFLFFTSDFEGHA